ncbi:asparagine synthase-related protein [Sinorhizobium psoraleae]|uniref:asparagine synthase-related protein n=1 Tax=Sinorhizobium psoraleae TaxID=520838 RepID=UPI0015697440|nr:asparagine synthase-related protein [Sinorhizobium psoraleae]
MPTISLDGTACLLANPSLLGEVTPEHLWKDTWLEWPNPTATETPGSLSRAFQLALSDLCFGHSTIAVQTSGGLDSLAVLYHTCRLFPDRRVISVCGDVLDDNGTSTLAVVQQLIKSLRLTCELVAVHRKDWTRWPAWSPHGPFRTASPEAHMAMVACAKRLGATTLLSGDGSDELVAAHRFMTKEIGQQLGLRAALQYLRDARHTGPGVAGEILALAANFAPPRSRIKMYWAVNWPDWCEPRAAAILTPRYRSVATDWASDWSKATLKDHVLNRRSWAEAEAYDAWWPQPYLPPADDLEEGSPFLHEAFVATALGQPLARKYSPAPLTEYHRFKVSVIELFDEDDRRYLPREKQYFKSLAAEIDDVPGDAPFAVDLGLFDQNALKRETDTATRKLARSVERWLRDASEQGVLFT